jgi:hypothetical protein
MGTGRKEESTSIPAIRWLARIFGVLLSGLLLFMIIGGSFDSLSGPEAITPIRAIGLGLAGLYIIAMFLALRWEHTGTLLGMGAIGASVVLVFLGPGDSSFPDPCHSD